MSRPVRPQPRPASQKPRKLHRRWVDGFPPHSAPPPLKGKSRTHALLVLPRCEAHVPLRSHASMAGSAYTRPILGTLVVPGDPASPPGGTCKAAFGAKTISNAPGVHTGLSRQFQ